MKRLSQIGLSALLASLLTSLATGCQTMPVASGSAPQSQTDLTALQNLSLPAAPNGAGQLLAGLEPAAIGRLQVLGIGVKPLLPAAGIYRLALPAGSDSADWTRRLNGVSGVRYAETLRGYQLDPLTTLQPVNRTALDLAKSAGSKLTAFKLQDFKPDDEEYRFQWNMRAIGMEKAWEITRSANQIIVAVIDSGVDPDHPDLADQLLPLEDVWGELGGPDRLVNRVTGQVLSFDGIDGNGHGTHVSGVIGALLNNAQGVAGIAGGGVKILPIKVTNLTGATDSALLVEAVKRAIDLDANVINMSIGALGSTSVGVSQALQAAINLARERGIVVVAASGNESERTAGKIAAVTVPAAFENVIAVGAFNEAGGLANYSNGGPELDLLAPGGESEDPILSTWPTYPTLENLQRRVRTLDYAMAAGTSMATPHVSAVAALLLSHEPTLTPAQVRSRLVATADDLAPAGFDEDSGYGKLNAFRALQASTDDARF